MSKKILHITNGDSLTSYLKELDFSDPILTWQEMLCEGPTIPNIQSKEFFDLRADFIKNTYDFDVNADELNKEISKLDNASQIDEIVLWFEYDLFCHINLLGVMNLLHQREITSPLSLVCSGRIKKEKSLKGLSELSPDELLSHYKNRIPLLDSDKTLAINLWRTYCGKDHNILKPYITQKSSFEYMGSCLKAHLKRFPDQSSGLSVIEENILKIIKDADVKSVHHLLGYILNYQGYYGFGDIQLMRQITHLKPFFSQSQKGLELNREGHEAFLGQFNFASKINNDIQYGGVKRLDFWFNKAANRLVKSILHEN